MARRHERPLKRVNPSGAVRWVARWTDENGNRSSAGTFALRGPCRAPYEGCCAQHAIDAAYDREISEASRPAVREDTVGAYAMTWTRNHPRAERTNRSYNHRVSRVLDVELSSFPLREWRMADVRPKHIGELVGHLLVEQGRSRIGAVGILRVLGAMWQDAISDEVCDFNPVRGVRIKRNDTRITKPPVEIRVFPWDEMHRFAAAAAAVRTGKDELSEMDRWRAVYAEAMVSVLADAGLRLGELLGLERRDVKGPGPCDEPGCHVTAAHLHVRRTAHEGMTQPGTKTDHGKPNAGRLAPQPPRLQALLAALPPRLDTKTLFPTPTGLIWREGLFYRDLWRPAQEVAAIDPRPHEFRHSWITLLRAAGINADEIARAAGHSVATQHARYSHPQGLLYGDMNDAVG